MRQWIFEGGPLNGQKMNPFGPDGVNTLKESVSVTIGGWEHTYKTSHYAGRRFAVEMGVDGQPRTVLVGSPVDPEVDVVYEHQARDTKPVAPVTAVEDTIPAGLRRLAELQPGRE